MCCPAEYGQLDPRSTLPSSDSQPCVSGRACRLLVCDASSRRDPSSPLPVPTLCACPQVRQGRAALEQWRAQLDARAKEVDAQDAEVERREADADEREQQLADLQASLNAQQVREGRRGRGEGGSRCRPAAPRLSARCCSH